VTTGSDKPDADAIARARAWVESETQKLLHPVDPLEGMTIHVQPPLDAKLIRGRRIHIGQMFIHREFDVTVATRTQRVRFGLDLPEWLEALTKFLRSDPRASVDEQLLMGSRFSIDCAGRILRVDCYDKDTRTRVQLELTEIQLRALHGRLVAELIVAAHRAADAFVQIDGIELLDIQAKPAP